MKHKKMQILVSGLLDGEISEQETNMAIKHLSECSKCKEFYTSSLQMRNSVQDIESIKLPYSFAERISAIVQHEKEKEYEWLSLEPIARNVFALIFTIVVILIAVIGIDNSNNTSSTTITLLNQTKTSDVVVANVIMQTEEISKDDVLYAVIER